jgi:hypothetical protein
LAIDAAVSLLQSAEIDVIFASVQLGELLDPINDAIERLSSVMLRAVGSLFLQRIVLEIASSPVFKWGFFAISLLAMLGMLLVAWERFCNLICEICGVSKTDLHRFSYVFITDIHRGRHLPFYCSSVRRNWIPG